MGDSLVLELQRLARSNSTSLTELLRHAKVVAAKLNIDEAVSWIDAEIDGYSSGDVPEYRIVPSELRAFNRFRGWEPVRWEAANPLQEFFSHAPSAHPIAQIEEFARGGDEQHSNLTQSQLDLLSQFSNHELTRFQLARFFSRTDFVRILEAVRMKVLNWTIALEKRGVLGHGMTFNAQEKQDAAAVPFSASDTVTLALMSANPDADNALEVEKEQHRITKERNGSKHQSDVRIEALPDADFNGVAKSLRLHKPALLHITGHGAPDGSIVLRDEEGQAYGMSPEGLARLLVLHKKSLRLVVLNACYSNELAKLLIQDLDCVIGMRNEIDDDAAILFSQTFYSSLFDGVSIGEAFETALAALTARYPAEAHNLVLSHRVGADPSQLHIVS